MQSFIFTQRDYADKNWNKLTLVNSLYLLQVYRETTGIQGNYRYTGKLQVYRETTGIQGNYRYTGKLQMYRETTGIRETAGIQGNYRYTGKLQVYRETTDIQGNLIHLRFKAWACDCSLAETVGSNTAEAMDGLSVVTVVFCEAEVSASGWSLVQRFATNYLGLRPLAC
jgi:hypothetical protein